MSRQKDCRLLWGQISVFLQCFTCQVSQRGPRMHPATLLHTGHVPSSQALASRQKRVLNSHTALMEETK